ncbi:Asparagine synthetase [glutamine-hydrolyzing] (EC [Olavius sp. associated proteobacterium Delta 1]|nr:Asparagine synthetase [glutamine-hydrolyzing] (EC [Olavius sp. associated proteobacterium Delta 1]
MCGIVAQKNSSQRINKAIFENMVDTLQHRGPDGRGADYLCNRTVALGHRRLAIIDLSEKGDQPLYNEGGSICISFNGEIYNFKSLRYQLSDRGHTFVSNTDTEVMIHGYEEWGFNFLEKVRGIFAFIIYDKERDLFFFARDHFGVKPLYYAIYEKNIIIASEIKAILKSGMPLRKIDDNALAAFFLFGYIPAPLSIWQPVRKLLPGHYATFENGLLTTHRYFKIVRHDQQVDPGVLVENTRRTLLESVRLQNYADVEVGLFLSGGLDSSALAYAESVLKKDITALSVEFKNDPRGSEVKDAKIVADACNLELYELFVDDTAVRLLQELTYFFDEPFGDSSLIPTYLLSRAAAKKHGFKVILSGDGGDEVFGGYNWYTNILQQLGKNPNGNRRCLLFENYASTPYPFFLNNKFESIFDSKFLPMIKRRKNSFWGLISQKSQLDIKEFQLLDFATYLPDDILTKVDRASMANSLEIRVPLLDHVLVKQVMGICPGSYFFQNSKKFLLKKMLANFFGPEVIEKEKRGFSLPLVNYLKTINYHEKIMDGTIRPMGIFQPHAIENLLKQPLANHVSRIFLLYVFTIWNEMWNN